MGQPEHAHAPAPPSAPVPAPRRFRLAVAHTVLDRGGGHHAVGPGPGERDAHRARTRRGSAIGCAGRASANSSSASDLFRLAATRQRRARASVSRPEVCESGGAPSVAGRWRATATCGHCHEALRQQWWSTHDVEARRLPRGQACDQASMRQATLGWVLPSRCAALAGAIRSRRDLCGRQPGLEAQGAQCCRTGGARARDAVA